MTEIIDLIREVLLQLARHGERLRVEGYEEEAVDLTPDHLRREGYIYGDTDWRIGHSIPG